MKTLFVTRADIEGRMRGREKLEARILAVAAIGAGLGAMIAALIR